MVFSRSVSLLLPKNNIHNRRLFSITALRNYHGPPSTPLYRNTAPPVSYGPRTKYLDILRTVTWSILCYKAWYDPWHVFGHPQFGMPDATKWTDEELGIPPDDYDEVL